ncbi:hypothetical protein ACFV9C_44630 [Kribbella sp. NPDC059898]|uniref:hypothetical protein n=1 Tax=Kribbella sp. NPDC059898 TaxID=3346995 RepID=UPI00366282B3
MATTVRWAGTLTAVSSVAHGGVTYGTMTMLRHMQVIQPDGRPELVPVVSGNAFRGRLRRIGEELLRDALDYTGDISLPAFHALRSGGALAKVSGQPLSGQRLADLRRLAPQVGVFGCAGGGRIIDGCLQVGMVVPIVRETLHLLPAEVRPADTFTIPAMRATQMEAAVRLDNTEQHGIPDIAGEAAGDNSTVLMKYSTQTFTAGTRFSTWLQLTRATPVEVSFFTEILQHFAIDSRLGGRAATGHGQVVSDLTRTVLTGPDEQADWRAHVHRHHDDALRALKDLS